MALIHGNGARLWYLRAGRGPAVVLVQGVGVAADGWGPQVDALQDRYDLVVFDNRGMGGSVALDGRMSIEVMAADTLALASALGLDRFHLVGHSMGGVIAQAVALSAPARVRSLAFLCTFSRGKEATSMTPGMLWTGLRTRIGTASMRRNAFLELVAPASSLTEVDRDALAARLAPLFGHDLAVQPPSVMAHLRAMSRYDARGRLADLAPIPTLVVSAAEDRIARPRFGRALAAAIPGARYEEIAQAGHGVTIFQAARVNDLLAQHFRAAGG